MSSIPFEKVAKFKVDDIFYECQYGMNMEFRVLTVPEQSEGYNGRACLSWTAVNTKTNVTIDFGLTKGLEHYGPRLYDEAEYVTVKDGKVSVELI